MLRFYGPVNPMGSCRARSVYLTTRLLGRLSPLSGYQYCAHSFARNWQLPFLNQRKGENDRRKYFTINLHERMLPTSVGVEPGDLLVSSRTAHPTQPPRPAQKNIVPTTLEWSTVLLEAIWNGVGWEGVGKWAQTWFNWYPNLDPNISWNSSKQNINHYKFSKYH